MATNQGVAGSNPASRTIHEHNMKFVIQKNLLNEGQLNRTFDAVKSFPHVMIDMKPFHEEIFSDDPLDGVDYIPYGSTLYQIQWILRQ